MRDFIQISPAETTENLLKKISEEWALLTAKKTDGTVSTMTISWGEFGYFWNRPIATVGVRPQRYTKEFMEEADGFSITFFPPEYKKKLSYLGTVSGRDENKIEKAELTVADHDGLPYFKEATAVFFCKTLYSQDLSEKGFRSAEIIEKNYLDKDFHTLYIGEISQIYVKS